VSRAITLNITGATASIYSVLVRRMTEEKGNALAGLTALQEVAEEVAKQACLAVCERIAPDFLAAARELYEADNLLSPNDIPAGVMDEENGVVCRTERHFITLPLKVWEQIEQGAFVGEKLSVPVQLSYLVAMGIHAHNESEKEPSDG
jgi:hypothetical protein